MMRCGHCVLTPPCILHVSVSAFAEIKVVMASAGVPERDVKVCSQNLILFGLLLGQVLT